MRNLTLALLLATLPACGSDADDTTTGTTSTTGTPATSDAPTTGTTTAVDPGTSSTTSSSTEPGTSTTDSLPSTTSLPDSTTDVSTTTTPGDTTTATTGEATSDLVIAIYDADLYADCEPEHDADPVFGQFYVGFDNFAGKAETSVVLLSASLSLADADPPVIEPIPVDLTESGPIPAGEQTEQKLLKLHGAMHSACDHCDEFYKLELEYDEAGYIHHVVEDVTIPCSV